MDNYVLSTDGNGDLPLSYLKDNGIECVETTYTMDMVEYTRLERPITEFYKLMREGKKPITSLINHSTFTEYFTPFLEAGKDILHLSFSSGLSGICENSQNAAADLSQKYPERKIYIVDTLAASLGQGLITHLVNEKRKTGVDIDELYEYAKEIVPKAVFWVTVDDLMHLQRGGRLSKTAAIAGSMLGIKPILHLDDNGKLVNVDKVRGRKQALAKIVEKMADSVEDTPNDIIFIGHADALEDANYVAELMKEKFGIDKFLIDFIGPVIGTHAGPGTIAIFMLGKNRNA